jgi:hypothetical protein
MTYGDQMTFQNYTHLVWTIKKATQASLYGPLSALYFTASELAEHSAGCYLLLSSWSSFWLR